MDSPWPIRPDRENAAMESLRRGYPLCTCGHGLSYHYQDYEWAPFFCHFGESVDSPCDCARYALHKPLLEKQRDQHTSRRTA